MDSPISQPRAFFRAKNDGIARQTLRCQRANSQSGRVLPSRGGWPTIPKLTCWVCGTNPSFLERWLYLLAEAGAEEQRLLLHRQRQPPATTSPFSQPSSASSVLFSRMRGGPSLRRHAGCAVKKRQHWSGKEPRLSKLVSPNRLRQSWCDVRARAVRLGGGESRRQPPTCFPRGKVSPEPPGEGTAG